MHSDADFLEAVAVGWLRDLMGQAQPPVPSYGALAREVLAHASWPNESRPQPRSLAALFSKLDRHQELDWLIERPAVQSAIAQVVGRPVADIATVLQRSPRSSASDAMLRLKDMPFARSLDLVREPLCPGLPPEVTLPPIWQRTWWYAPDGAGRSLVAAWLSARGLCQVVHAPYLEEALSKLAGGPAFVCIDYPTEAHASKPSVRADVCVAAPFPPGGTESERSGVPRGQPGESWQVIRSPPPEQYVEQLVNWTALRLQDDGHFDPETGLAWLLAVPMKQGFVDSLGTLLGLLGALDELDTRKLRVDSLTDLAAHYFAHRLEHALPRDTSATAWLRREGIDVVVGICTRLLVEGADPWRQSRSFDDWLGLVPIEHQRVGDLDWMRLALSTEDSAVRPGDIAKAAKRIPPGAFQVVLAMEQAELLRKDERGWLAIRPRWFSSALTRVARSCLLDRSPLEWGEVLLNPYEAEHMFHNLFERTLKHDMNALEAALEVETDDDPAGTAALEASFVVAGLSLLAGSELPQDLLENLWNEQLRLLIELNGQLPHTRLLFVSPTQGCTESRQWFTSGIFHVAALAISEQLPQGAGRRHALLRPWSGNDAPKDLARLYDSIQNLLTWDNLAEFRPRLIAMIDRLRATIGQANQEPHPLEYPGIVLDEVEHDVLRLELVAKLEHVPEALTLVKALAGLRNMSWDGVAGALWQAWFATGQAEQRPWFSAVELAESSLMWSTIPEAVLKPLLEIRGSEPLPFGCFGAVQWSAFATAWSESKVHVESDSAWQLMPEEIAARCLAVAGSSCKPLQLACLWRRFPALLEARVRACLSESRSQDALQLMSGASQERTKELVSLLREHGALPQLNSGTLDQLRHWLCERSSAREAGWRDAYGLLCNIEETLAPIKPRL